MATVQNIYADQSGKTINTFRTSPDKAQYDEVNPDSLGERILDFVCTNTSK
jgi:hypothetical protein